MIRENFRPAEKIENTPHTLDMAQDGSHQGITHITTDTTSVVAQPGFRKDNYTRYVSMQDKEAENTIKQFLARPLLQAKGTFATTDTITTVIQQIDLQGLLCTSAWYSKYQGHYGIRCDFRFTLMVNPNRYQQGRYWLLFVPSGGSVLGTGSNGLAKTKAHMFSLMSRSQLPHVELDLSCETQAEFVIPYQSVTPFIPITSTNGTYSLGTLFLMAYSPLVSPTGTATCGYSLFASLENVHFQGAAIPQMGTISEQEQKESKTGPISTALTNVGKAATVLSKVPILSSFATEAAWAANIGAQVASAFGWSKPQIVSPHGRMIRNTFLGWNNCDVPDASNPMSLTASNNVAPIPGAMARDIDEMNISYIAQKWSYYRSFNWADTDATGALLWNNDVTPVQTTSYTDATKSVNAHTPLSFCATLFRFWRGGIKFRFKIVKTEFHSGRLAVSFHPFSNNLSPANTTSLENTWYLEREIIDLRYGTEFTVTIPWMNVLAYRPTDATVMSFSTGFIQVHVLDQLTRPSNVNASVQILVEVAGAEDIEFAFPRETGYVPYLPSAIQMADITQECAVVDKPIGSMVEQESGTLYAEMCIGEKITSFRQLLKSTNYLPYVTNPAAGTRALIAPFSWEPYDNSTGTPVQVQSVLGDVYTLMSAIFTSFTGGVRIKLMSTAATKNKWVAVASAPTYHPVMTLDSPTITNQYPNYSKLGLVVPSNPLTVGGIELTCPQYNWLPGRSTIDCMATNMSLAGTNNTNFNYAVAVYMGEALIPAIARLGADDITFYGFISIPPLIDTSNVSTATANLQ